MPRSTRVDGSGSDEATAALTRRLLSVAPILAPERRLAGLPVGEVLEELVAAVGVAPSMDRVWLLVVAVSTVFPDADGLRTLTRGLRARPGAGAATRWLLAELLGPARTLGDVGGDLVVVDRGVLVDVDFTARNDLHTGVQRVVRELVPRWVRDRDIVPVGWTRTHGALCALAEHERTRVLRWSGDPRPSGRPMDRPARPTIVVPWRSVVVLAEVSAAAATPRLAALAAHSGNELVAIGYDCIPVVSAHLLPRAEPERFTRYLAAIKHAHRVAGISETAAREFRGFARMLPAQGLRGPDVVAVPLPAAASAPTPAAAPEGEPVVLCVGTLDARKNPLAVLHAAERLWREGLRFRLQFVAGGGAVTEAARRIDALAAAGRRVAVARGIADDDLHELYRSARFTVFASLHEGYGLPVAESLAHGVPALTTGYGSTAEIAAGGGVMTVDPRDDDGLCAAMRTLLTDDAVLQRLRGEIAARPAGSWDAYADALWAELVAPGLP